VIQDVAELNFLSQLQAKREAEMRVRGQQEWGLKTMAAAINGVVAPPVTVTTPVAVTPAATAPVNRIAEPIEFAAPGGLMNRSPITNNHYHTYSTAPAPPTVIVEPQSAPAPTRSRRGISPWWLVIPAAVAIAGATYLLWPKPKPVPPPTPAPAPVAAQPTLNSTIRWSQVP
jgi:hypothetical protein